VRLLEAVSVVFTETADALIATVDLSSLDMRNVPNDMRGQFKVWVDEAGLTIALKVKQETCTRNQTTSLDILSTRTIELPCSVDYEKITATSEAAEKKLVLHMPRTQEAAQSATEQETSSEA
jgi:tRNA U34 5-carboxymethylaminomethyl modifying enzyme MnmG/GidA